MEVAGCVIGLHDLFWISTMTLQAIFIARVALKRLKKKEARNGVRES